MCLRTWCVDVFPPSVHVKLEKLHESSMPSRATHTRWHFCACTDEGGDQEWNGHDKDEFVLQHTQVNLLLRLQLARPCIDRIPHVLNIFHSRHAIAVLVEFDKSILNLYSGMSSILKRGFITGGVICSAFSPTY